VIKTLVYTYEKRDLLKKEFLNKLDSIFEAIDIYGSVVRRMNAVVYVESG